MATNNEKDNWTTTIQKLFAEGRLTSHQCIIYNKDSDAKTIDERCGCQRPIRHHSFDGPSIQEKPKPKDWNVRDHTKRLESLIYHSTPSRKVRLSKSFCKNYNGIFVSIIHLVLTMF